MQAAGKMACSCRAECVAMAAGLQMLIRNLPRKRCRRVAAVFTDSLSLLTALNTGPLRVRDGILRRIWTLILSLVRDKARPSFPFVFGHCGVPGNEAVDAVAKQAAELPQDVSAWITDMITIVRRRRTCGLLAQADEYPTYRQLLLRSSPMTPKSTTLTRLGETLVAQFRCNVSMHFGWFHRAITNVQGTHCRFCGATAHDSFPLYDDGMSDHSISPPNTPRIEPEPPPSANEDELSSDSSSDSSTSTDSDEAAGLQPDAPRASRCSGPAFCPVCWLALAMRGSLVTHMSAVQASQGRVHSWPPEMLSWCRRKVCSFGVQ